MKFRSFVKSAWACTDYEQTVSRRKREKSEGTYVDTSKVHVLPILANLEALARALIQHIRELDNPNIRVGGVGDNSGEDDILDRADFR